MRRAAGLLPALLAALLVLAGCSTSTEAVARGGTFEFVTPGGKTEIFYDPPGRTLFALRDLPRSVVPLTVVLDRQHRVAAVYLREISAADLLPVVDRLAA